MTVYKPFVCLSNAIMLRELYGSTATLVLTMFNSNRDEILARRRRRREEGSSATDGKTKKNEAHTERVGMNKKSLRGQKTSEQHARCV